VPTTLFVERFLVEPEPTSVPDATYDEKRAYAVTQDGRPIVAISSAGETHTVTEVANEAPDSDPAPDVQTLTFVEAEGADVAYSLSSTETVTRVKAESPDEPWAFAETETFTKVRGEAPDEPAALSTMTKTGVDYPRDDDSD
jgi:hypothetical protein